MTTNAIRTPDTTWIPDTSSLGARLALIRWRMSWNIAEAERECDISQNSWANWENGAEPRKYIEVMGKIAWRTKVDRMWLMTGEGNPQAAERQTLDYGADGSLREPAPVITLRARLAPVE